MKVTCFPSTHRKINAILSLKLRKPPIYLSNYHQGREGKGELKVFDIASSHHWFESKKGSRQRNVTLAPVELIWILKFEIWKMKRLGWLEKHHTRLVFDWDVMWPTRLFDDESMLLFSMLLGFPITHSLSIYLSSWLLLSLLLSFFLGPHQPASHSSNSFEFIYAGRLNQILKSPSLERNSPNLPLPIGQLYDRVYDNYTLKVVFKL